jgi:hypothetical protein
MGFREKAVIVFRYLMLWAGVASIPGCMIMTPTPTAEAMQVISSAVTTMASLSPISSNSDFSRDYSVPASVCIEWNPQVPIEDLVPAVQTELKRLKVDSRVYDVGMAPSSCPAMLQYVARVAWGKPVLGDDYAPYITSLSLSLRRNGSVLASSSYQIDDLGYDRWKATRKKVAPLVDRLFVR